MHKIIFLQEISEELKIDKLIIGFATGAMSLCSLCWKQGKLTELQGLRPHMEKITQICMHRRSRLVATAAQDLTIFLLKFSEQCLLEPLGYLEVDAGILNMQWNNVGNYIIKIMYPIKINLIIPGLLHPLLML
jgi:hypothetical protein